MEKEISGFQEDSYKRCCHIMDMDKPVEFNSIYNWIYWDPEMT